MSASAAPLEVAAPPELARRGRTARVLTPALVALGCGALAARAAVAGATTHPTAALVLLFGALLIVGECIPLPGSSRVALAPSVAVALVGIGAFVVGRGVVGGHAPLSLSGYAIATSTLAAVAEEVWFRRLCFGLLLPAGSGFAIAGSTVLFAIVHVATYGWWVLPLDLAAGALFGWQRAVSGWWTVPAITHVVANLLVLL